MTPGDQPAALGAYGFVVRGLGDERGRLLLHRIDSDRPAIELRVAFGGPRPAEAGDVFLEFLEGGVASVDRSPAVAHLWFPEPIPVPDLVHPHLTAVAGQFAQWCGMQTMHGGLVAAGGAAVAVVGDREAGKSTLLAACSADPGLHVMADDLVVIEDGVAHAGPRTLDLRTAAVGQFANLVTEPVRGSARHRLALPDGPLVAAFAGTVVLQWGPSEVRRLEGRARVAALEAHMPMDRTRGSVGNLLAAAARPVWLCSRPRDWEQLAWSVEAVRSVLREGAT